MCQRPGKFFELEPDCLFDLKTELIGISSGPSGENYLDLSRFAESTHSKKF
ncbi:MAG: hypothetical protein QOJ88_728 [Pyrinomonadaceae bacterium]|nr:hypothetical protein [Pyrinomonadaceae bacterium]